MSGVLHVLKKILLLAWLVFLVLCAHSCLMASEQPAADTAAAPVSAAPVQTAVPIQTVSETAPTPEPVSETTCVALSSGSYERDISSLTAVVTPEDLALLDSFSSLQTDLPV